MKKFLALFLLLPVFCFAEVNESISVSGGGYELRLNGATGAVESVCIDGKELTLASGKKGLWSARLLDGSVVSAGKISKIVRDGKLLVLSYEDGALPVSVTITAEEDFVDFQADLTPRRGDVIEFSVPGRLEFSPDAVDGVVCHSNVTTNIGSRFNVKFFRPVREAGKDLIWKKDKVIGEAAVRKLFGSPFLNLGNHYRDIPLTVTEEASKWLLPEDMKLLSEIRLTPSRPFGDGQAEVALLKYKDKVVMGGTRFGGSGLFFRTGTFQPSNASCRKIMEVIVGMIRKHRLEVVESPRKRVALIFLPYGIGAPKPELREWLAAFRKASVDVELIRNPEELERALHSPETAAIVNPGNEFCLPLPGKDLVGMTDDLKRFVKEGGYWFEGSGYSFYYQLGVQEYMTTKRNGVPGALADFFHFELNGRNAALYAVQPVSWEPFAGQKDRKAVFVPSVFELGGSVRGGFLERAFMIYAEKGKSFQTPVTRLRFRKNALESLKAFAEDNRIEKKLEEKVSAELLRAVSRGVMFHPRQGRTSEKWTRRALPYLPENTIVHISQYLKGGFDKQYPDHLPPAKWWGTMDGFRSLVREIRERGLLFMPYTNNTWWCDNPRGPTFLAAGEDALQKDLGGKPMKEAYAGNGGWKICMWHPAVRRANDSLLRQFTEDLPSDIVFQDQSGVRQCFSVSWQKATGYDRNPASPAPHAVTEGFLSQVRRDAKRVPLATEECWWGLVDSEFMVCGFSGGICQFMSWQGSVWNKWPEETWNFFPVLQGLTHDKLILTHHDLAGDVSNSARIAWTLALGYSMVSRADVLSPAGREWFRWLDCIQKAVCSRYTGKELVSFSHERGKRMEPGVVRAVYGDVSVIANLCGEPLREGNIVIAPEGFLVRSSGVTAGVISGCGKFSGNGAFVAEGSAVNLFAAPGEQAVFPLPYSPRGLRSEAGPLKFRYENGAVLCTLPAAEGTHKRLWKIEIER